jgi:putative FmdB family regulatory protein
MPTYEYRCENGHLFERFQRMTDPPLDRCVECGAPAERLLSPGAGILFKGSGFYITDYRSDAYKKAAAADSAGGKADSAGGKKDSAGGKKESGGSSGSGGEGSG